MTFKPTHVLFNRRTLKDSTSNRSVARLDGSSSLWTDFSTDPLQQAAVRGVDAQAISKAPRISNTMAGRL